MVKRRLAAGQESAGSGHDRPRRPDRLFWRQGVSLVEDRPDAARESCWITNQAHG